MEPQDEPLQKLKDWKAAEEKLLTRAMEVALSISERVRRVMGDFDDLASEDRDGESLNQGGLRL
jgi:hypothetical protein